MFSTLTYEYPRLRTVSKTLVTALILIRFYHGVHGSRASSNVAKINMGKYLL